jgi:hypothetical protein
LLQRYFKIKATNEKILNVNQNWQPKVGAARSEDNGFGAILIPISAILISNFLNSSLFLNS